MTLKDEIKKDRDIFTNPDEFGEEVDIETVDGTHITGVNVVAQGQPMDIIGDEDGMVEQRVRVVHVSAGDYPDPRRGDAMLIDAGDGSTARFHVDKREHRMGMRELTLKFKNFEERTHEGARRRR